MPEYTSLKVTCIPEYEVALICEKKRYRQHRQKWSEVWYKVVWKGWENHPEGKQWLRDSELGGCRELINDFERGHGERE